jgi:hypothetical protein
MKVIFGIRSAKIKDQSASTVGYTGPGDSQLTFQVFVKYFHIYLIPFWPMGRHSKIVDTASKQEVTVTTPALRHAATMAELKSRNPVWTFSGLMAVGVLALVIILIPLSESLSSAANYKREDRAFMDKMSALINQPQHNDVYVFEMTKLDTYRDGRGNQKNIAGMYVTLQYHVIDSQQDSITLRLLSHDLHPTNEIVPLIQEIVTIHNKKLIEAAETQKPSLFWKDMEQPGMPPRRGVRIPNLVKESIFGLAEIKRGNSENEAEGETH